MPGAIVSCVLITILTALLAWFSGHMTVDPVLRTLYFAVLFAAFQTIRRREPSLDTTSFRLVVSGFLVLTLGFAAAAILRLSNPHGIDYLTMLLCECFEHGAVFLIGVSLITYGILLSLPALVESYRLLQQDYVKTRGQLRKVASSHSRMELRVVEAERFRALGELAAGVAHDLRNPLTIVKTAAEALTRKQRSPEFIEEHSQVIQRNVERAERTITALLDFGKPRELTKREHDLSELVAEAVTLVRPEARRRKIEIQLVDGDATPVITDHKLLGQALLNLLLNALQASDEDSLVLVRTRAFHWTNGSLAAIFVEDRGSGLQSTDRTQLFHPFFTTKDGGTGLGLLSCRRILDDLGGNIGLFPRLRGGARAVVILPTIHCLHSTGSLTTTGAVTLQ